MNHEPSWSHPNQVKAGLRPISRVSSLDALISFVQHYGDKNLALVVVGDRATLGDRERAARSS